MTRLPFDTSIFPPELTLRENAERLDAIQTEVARYFDSTTRRQRAAFANTTAMSALKNGHGSKAHTAAVDRAHLDWILTTAEARALYEATVECLLTEGEISTELDEAWTALSDREKETT